MQRIVASMALVAWLALLSCSACGGGTGASETAASASPLVGTWQVEGAEGKIAFNTKGRVLYDLGTLKCAGEYTTAGDQLTISYDAGQPSCVGGAMAYKIAEPSLTVGPMSFKRIDSKEPSF